MLLIRDRIKERSEAQVLNLYPGLRMITEKSGKLLPNYTFYDYNTEGIIASHNDKLPFSESMYNNFVKEWNKYKSYIRVPFKGEVEDQVNHASPTNCTKSTNFIKSG